MKKAIIYTRVSTGAQTEGTSLEAQELACLKKAAEMQAQVVATISDPGISGGLYFGRPGIQEALTRIENGEANTLVIYKLDRSGRDVDVIRAIRNRVESAGAQIVFADGMNFESNAVGKLAFNTLAGFAEFEREVIRERTSNGRRRRAESGIQPSRTVSPFGYHVVTNPDVLRGAYPAEQLGTYQIVPEHATYAAAMFHRYATGDSLRAICRWLADCGIPTPQNGDAWRPGTVKVILKNPVYKGEPMFGRWQSRSDESRLQRGLKRAEYHIRTTPDQQTPLSAPALVDAALWDTVQRRLETNQSMLGGNPERRYMLSGLLRCPHCGKSMSGELNKGMTYYGCGRSRTLKSVGVKPCPPMRVRADEVERAVIACLIEACERPELVERAIRVYSQRPHSGDVGGSRRTRPG
jgi:site-specific DNA recombinase